MATTSFSWSFLLDAFAAFLTTTLGATYVFLPSFFSTNVFLSLFALSLISLGFVTFPFFFDIYFVALAPESFFLDTLVAVVLESFGI